MWFRYTHKTQLGLRSASLFGAVIGAAVAIDVMNALFNLHQGRPAWLEDSLFVIALLAIGIVLKGTICSNTAISRMYVKGKLGVNLSDSEADYVSLLHDGTLPDNKWYTLDDLHSKPDSERKTALLTLAKQVRKQFNLPTELGLVKLSFWDRVME